MNKEVIIQEEIKYTVIGYTNLSVSYSNETKTAKAKFNILTDENIEYDYPEIILWEGDEYDAIGQWTDDDVNDRIEFLFL